mgnify:CR=1 FL=1
MLERCCGSCESKRNRRDCYGVGSAGLNEEARHTMDEGTLEKNVGLVL